MKARYLARLGFSVCFGALAMLGQYGSAHADGWTVFDESRSFDSNYAARWRFLSSVTKSFVEAVFAGHNLPTNEDVLRTLPRTAKVPRFNGTVYATDPLCGCKFDIHGQLVDPTHCPAMSGVGDEDKAHMALLLVIDKDYLARPLACYRVGSPYCRDDGGTSYGGITCCERTSKDYAGALRDPEFYVLAPAALVDRVKGLRVGRAKAESPAYCGVAIDTADGVFSLPRKFDGLVARAWLHAMKHYGTKPPVTPDVLAKISASTPALLFEISRERLIRSRWNGGNDLYDAALRAVPLTQAFRDMGIR
ncbi:MAG: hypothetical protein EPN75_08690 [Beijerinckiaceae bacterium]|nr:MAG: hypothetical protein EPN75_08690 [Beijerinckiaceae bacterium]